MANALERNQAQKNLSSLRGSVNHKMPPFPCTVLAYSKSPSVNSFQVILFSDQATFDRYRIMTVAMVRVALSPDDLADVPEDKLRFIYNKIAGQEASLPADSEVPIEELRGLTFGVLKGAAIPYEEIQMTTTASPEVEAKTKAEADSAAKKAEREAAKAKKSAEKAQREAERKAKRADGVIGTIKAALDTDAGTTQDEILDKLVAKFPDRTRDGMSSTVKIQFSRLAVSQGRSIINKKIVGRGRVYKFADKGPVQGVEEVAEKPAPAATAAAPAAEVPATPVPTTPAPAPAPVAAAPATKPAPSKKK